MCRSKTQTHLSNRELNQVGSKPATVNRPVKTACTFVHHYIINSNSFSGLLKCERWLYTTTTMSFCSFVFFFFVFRPKLSSLKLWSLLTTNRMSYISYLNLFLDSFSDSKPRNMLHSRPRPY